MFNKTDKNKKKFGLSSEVESILSSRSCVYGSFKDNSVLSQELKKSIRYFTNMNDCLDDKKRLSNVQREALDVILQKISRIVCGGGNHEDDFLDIIGYCSLVLKDMRNS